MDEKNRTEEPQEERTLEEIFAQLDQVVEKMEGELPLEESFRLFRQGMDMLKQCNDRIDRVEKKMMVLDEGGEMHEF